ncbi:type B 50S ribosomal protein L31 [Pedococcus aerophilus]|uniref:Large ribosomal subunit protein bL31B n=1 Tax=Pedococcus aerophilus TaxID=436356 RepID=A0ABP6H8F4_9MICO
MKPGIHPEYRPVVFEDATTGDAFLTRSTVVTSLTTTWTDGRTLPLVKVEVSSASHPFWTGRARVLDSEGRVEQFRRRYGTTR